MEATMTGVVVYASNFLTEFKFGGRRIR